MTTPTAARLFPTAGPFLLVNWTGSTKSGTATVLGRLAPLRCSSYPEPWPDWSSRTVGSRKPLSREETARVCCDLEVLHLDHSIITQQPLLRRCAKPTTPHSVRQVDT